MILGPFVGGTIATVFELRAVFLFNGVTKLAVLLIVLFLIRETNPQVEGVVQRHPLFDRSVLDRFRTRSFLIIALVAFTVSMTSQGTFGTLFPLFLHDSGSFSPSEIGTLMTLAGIAVLLISLPNGWAVDTYGRKATLIPGLLVLGAAVCLLSRAVDFRAAVLIVLTYGVGVGACMGAAQVYVMDLAPADRRGAFLGMWALLDSSGGAIAPLLVGFTAERLGFPAAFTAVGIMLAVMAFLMWRYGPDTYGGHRAAAARTTAARS